MESAPPVAGLFPPLDNAWAVGTGCYSANVLERICDLAQELSGLPAARRHLERSLPLKVTVNQVWQQATRVGAQLVSLRDEAVLAQECGHPSQGPANAPQVLVLEPDGGRLQDRSRSPGERWSEYKAFAAYRLTRGKDEPDEKGPDPQPQSPLRYTDLHAKPEVLAEKKKYRAPTPEVKTYLATTEKVECYIQLAEFEARQRGLAEAQEVVFVGDGGAFVWRSAQELSEIPRRAGKTVYEILDIIHAGQHLQAAAQSMNRAGQADALPWLNARHAELWAGQTELLLAALQTTAEQLGPRPLRKGVPSDHDHEDDLDELPTLDQPPVLVLWRCHDYFKKHKKRIRYDLFRRMGLPLTSTQIESGINRINWRVKGSQKSWFLEHAEEFLALRTSALSEDGRWDRFWDGVRMGTIVVPVRSPAPVRPRPKVSPQTATPRAGPVPPSRKRSAQVRQKSPPSQRSPIAATFNPLP